MSGKGAQRLTVWAVATFHASLFVIASVLVSYRGGGLGSLLAGLNTLVGLGLFAALWATTLFTTERALVGMDLLGEVDELRFARRVFRWGAANGMAFLGVLGLVLIAGATVALPQGGSPFGLLTFALVAAPFALIVAAAVGGVVGVLFAVIDLGLIALAGSVSRART
jgi:hypothetical protein